MKRRRKTGLPRLTVMAMNRRDLLRFWEAIESASALMNDLRTHADQLERLIAGKRGRRRQADVATGDAPADRSAD